MPTQLKAVGLNAAVAGIMLMLYGSGKLGLGSAAVGALAGNAGVRMVLRGNGFAVAQFVAAVGVFVLEGDWWFGGAYSSLGKYEKIGWALMPDDGDRGSAVFGGSQAPWTVILAVASIVAGGMVQGCSGGETRFGLNEACAEFVDR